MSNMASWWWLHQLAGATVDVPGQTLWLSPRLPSSLKELHIPLYLPRAWLWLDYAPEKNIFRLKVLRHFGEPMTFKRVGGDPNDPAVELPALFVATQDAVLDLAASRAKLVTVASRPPVIEPRSLPFVREGLPTLSWTAIGSDTNTNFHADDAYDGFAHTRWQSSKPASSNLSWQLDMGRSESFKSVSDVTSPPGLVIELSADGKQWQLLNPGDAQHQGRYLQLKPIALAPATEPWRVFEVTVLP